ncbi:MAG: hypothetical protein QG633_302 [Patescibacteria group bacterium]|jgi:hypothetical protein|nr:hypothetical protein [Patescibacteria group bacterium]
MARRAAAPTAPSTAKQQGGKTALFIKKIPKMIMWIFIVCALIGVGLGIAFGFIGSFLNGLSDGTIPGFGTFFQIGFILGLGGAVILYLRFAGFEDVQEGGRAFIASLTIGTCAAVAFSVFLPMFVGHNTLRSFFIGGIAIAAIMAIANIFLKDDYLRVVKWGAMLAAVALLGLIAIKVTDGKGFDINIKWPWENDSPSETKKPQSETISVMLTPGQDRKVCWTDLIEGLGSYDNWTNVQGGRFEVFRDNEPTPVCEDFPGNPQVCKVGEHTCLTFKLKAGEAGSSFFFTSTRTR